MRRRRNILVLLIFIVVIVWIGSTGVYRFVLMPTRILEDPAVEGM